MNICIYGASSDAIDESYKKAARELGRQLGEASVGMVFGGGATGLMDTDHVILSALGPEQLSGRGSEVKEDGAE